MLIALSGGVDFYKLRKVYVFMTKLMLDRVAILSKAVCGHLKAAVGCSLVELLSEGVAIKGLLKEGEYLDIAKNDGQGPAGIIVKQVKAFYIRSR